MKSFLSKHENRSLLFLLAIFVSSIFLKTFSIPLAIMFVAIAANYALGQVLESRKGKGQSDLLEAKIASLEGLIASIDKSNRESIQRVENELTKSLMIKSKDAMDNKPKIRF